MNLRVRYTLGAVRSLPCSVHITGANIHLIHELQTKGLAANKLNEATDAC